MIRPGGTVVGMTNIPTGPAIAVTGLRRPYGSQVVLDGIDLHVPEGAIVALLGPNGAGKTTMVQILSTLIRADAGEARICGHDVAREPDRVRAAIGVTGQFSAVDDFLTGEENLLLMADLHHLGRAERRRRTADLLERFGLREAARRPAVAYSGGMRRRLDLAMGLIGDPRVIFLDEPTTGLDPRSRRDMWQIVRDLAARGVTIFLTTQYLEEADQLADRIALLDHGRLVAEGTPAELKRRVPGGHVELRFADGGALAAAAAVLDVAPDPAGESLVLRVPGDGRVRSLKVLLDRLDAAAVEVDGLTVHTPGSRGRGTGDRRIDAGGDPPARRRRGVCLVFGRPDRYADATRRRLGPQPGWRRPQWSAGAGGEPGPQLGAVPLPARGRRLLRPPPRPAGADLQRPGDLLTGGAGVPRRRRHAAGRAGALHPEPGQGAVTR